MRRKFIAGNWKMNTDAGRRRGAGGGDCREGRRGSRPSRWPSARRACILEAVGQAIEGSAVGLGAQNCYHEAKGRSPAKSARRCCVDIGCKYVILGHSERRQIFKETNQDVNRKVLAALARRV